MASRRATSARVGAAKPEPRLKSERLIEPVTLKPATGDNQPEAMLSSDVIGGWKTKYSGGYKFQTGTTSPVTSFEILADGKIKLSASTPTYPDNAAAIAGGLTTNTLYKTPTGDVKIVL